MADGIDTASQRADETKALDERSASSSKESVGDSAVTKPRPDVMRDYFKRREQAGDKRVTVWLSKEARAALARLKDRHGSNDAAVEHCLLHCDRVGESAE